MTERWEYCELELQYGGPQIFGRLWIYKQNGKHEESEVNKYGAELARLGSEGWELVASSSHAAFPQHHENTVSYLFKRPIKDK